MEHECGCRTCLQDKADAAKLTGNPYNFYNHPLNRMVLCVSCGNKRCPHATDHRLDCTNSNEPGQKGSVYE